MSAQSRRWVFTLPNPDAAQRLWLEALECVYIVYGDEVAPTTGTPHLQGFVIFAAGKRRTTLAAGLPCYWHPANGKSSDAATYCKKDGQFTERGVLPDNPGRRTDLERAIDWCDEFFVDNLRGPTDREIAQSVPVIAIKYPRYTDIMRLRAPAVSLRQGEPRDWQRELAVELENVADDRSVVFYLDEEGGTGKTWFQQWFYTEHPDVTQILGVGRVIDMAFAVDADRSVFLINVPRGGMQFFQYSIVEQLKDRMVFSTKYVTVMKTFPTNVHVIVFCNEAPDYEKLSADRIVLRSDYN